MFEDTKILLDRCKKEDREIWEILLEHEKEKTGISKDYIWQEMKHILKVMEESSQEGLEKPMPSNGGLIGQEAYRLEAYRKKADTFSSPFILSAVARAFSTSQVNACMGKIVAAPTAGASGIVPAIIFSARDRLELSEDRMIEGLLTATAVGEIIAKRATISGAEGGCQAECGAAAAMAAAALVYMAGGSPEESFHAASFALTNIMGLVCDPVAGLVEYPCALRNASGVTNAYLSADLALAGIESLIPFDEVVQAMFEVGNSMPNTLKETALGGLANTTTGQRIKEELLSEE